MAKWYVAQIQTIAQQPDKFENRPRIEVELDRLDIDHFNPTQIEVCIHRRTKKPVHRRSALIPGYVFITGDFSWVDLKSAKGVVDIIGVHGEPYAVPSSAIDELKLEEARLFDKFLRDEAYRLIGKRRYNKRLLANLFPKGSLVRIHSDNWGTLMATVDEATGRGTVKVMVDLLGRLTPVETGVENLEKVA